MPLEGEIGNLCHRSIGRMPSDRKLAEPRRKPCDPDRVLFFEVSGLRRRTPVRPVPTGQTGQTHRSNRFDAAAPPLWFFSLGFVDQPRNLMVFW
jgi:hypothetical protein